MQDQNETLVFFKGRKTPDDFLNDVESFLSLGNELCEKIIQNAIAWYPKRNIDAEVERWLSGKTDEEKEKIGSALDLQIFLLRSAIINRLKEQDLRKELKKISYPDQVIEIFVREFLGHNSELITEMTRLAPEIIPTISNLLWRIDSVKMNMLSEENNEPTALLKMTFSDRKTEDIVVELDYRALCYIIETLSLIKQEMEKYRKKLQ